MSDHWLENHFGFGLLFREISLLLRADALPKQRSDGAVLVDLLPIHAVIFHFILIVTDCDS